MSRSAWRPLVLLPILLLLGCSEGPAHDSTPARPVLVVHPLAGNTTAASYFGEVRARHEPKLAFRLTGKISQRLVDVGDAVKKGQPLAKLDAEDLDLQLNSAVARVAAAQADRQLAQADLRRYSKLLARQVISQSQFDTVEARDQATEASLEQARAALKVARNQRDYAVLRAPSDGVIASRQAEAGQVVAAGQTIFTLAVAGEREIRTALPEQAIAGVRVGQPVRISLWVRPNENFAGHIRELAPAADPVSRTYETRIAFDNAPVQAHLGQSARVALIINDAAAPLSVPLAALSADPERPFVWVVGTDHKVHKTRVRIGSYHSKQVPILDGLNATDWVVAAGTQVLHDGETVRPIDRDNRPLALGTE